MDASMAIINAPRKTSSIPVNRQRALKLIAVNMPAISQLIAPNSADLW